MKRSTLRVFLVTGITAAALATGTGALSYFSDVADPVQNSYHVVAGSQNEEGTVGTITEAGWPAEDDLSGHDANGDGVDDRKQMQPGQMFVKDPVLTSNVDYRSVGYIKVEIPTIRAKKAEDTEARVYDVVTLGGIGADWSEDPVYSAVSGNAGTDSVYVYRYNKELGTASASDAATASPVFSTITVGNFTEIDGTDPENSEGLAGSINVTGALVQSVGNAEVAEDGTITGAEGEGKADAIAKNLFGIGGE